VAGLEAEHCCGSGGEENSFIDEFEHFLGVAAKNNNNNNNNTTTTTTTQ